MSEMSLGDSVILAYQKSLLMMATGDFDEGMKGANVVISASEAVIGSIKEMGDPTGGLEVFCTVHNSILEAYSEGIASGKDRGLIPDCFEPSWFASAEDIPSGYVPPLFAQRGAQEEEVSDE